MNTKHTSVTPILYDKETSIQPDNLPVGNSHAPHDMTNVWTRDNHGRYLVGNRWTANELRIRRLDELDVK